MKRAISLVLSICLMLSLAGCGKGAYEKGMNLTYLLPQDIFSLDPQTARRQSEKIVISMIFEGLCRLDGTGQAIPGVAQSWEANSDFTSFTFHLREGTCWSDGTPLGAEDFLFGIQRALSPNTGAMGIESLFIIRGAMEIASGEEDMDALGVSIIDERTIAFELTSSYEDFPQLTADSRFMPCQRDFFENTVGHYGMDCIYTLTNGPFTFATNYAWEKSDSSSDSTDRTLKLAKTVLYKGHRDVMPASLTLLLHSNSINRSNPVAALGNGDADILPIVHEQVETVKEHGGNVLTLNDCVYGLLLNTKSEYLKQPSMREIYIRSINREEVLHNMGETHEEALGIMPKNVKWQGKSYQIPGNAMYPKRDENISDTIPGILNSLELEQFPSITVICLNDEYSVSLATRLIISWNNSLDNAFNLEALDPSSYLSRLESGNYQAALYNFSSNGNSPVSVFSQFSSQAIPQLLDDEEYDDQLKSLAFNREAYTDLENYLVNSFVFYPIHYSHSYYASAKNVEGISVSSACGPDFTQALKRSS